jgi:hypothetical protein
VEKLSVQSVDLSRHASNVDGIAVPNATPWNIVALAHTATVATVGIRNALYEAKERKVLALTRTVANHHRNESGVKGIKMCSYSTSKCVAIQPDGKMNGSFSFRIS